MQMTTLSTHDQAKFSDLWGEQSAEPAFFLKPSWQHTNNCSNFQDLEV